MNPADWSIWSTGWRSLWAVAAEAAVVLLFFLLLVWQKRRYESVKARLERAGMLLENLRHSRGLDKNLEYILELTGTMIDVPLYTFYIYDVKNRQYVIQTVRHSETDFGKVGPSYSGLTPYKKETYIPPMALGTDSVPAEAGIVMDGEVPLFSMPLGGHGVIRLGPVERVDGSLKRRFMQYADQLVPIIPELVFSESLREQVEVVVASGKALQNISGVAIDPKIALDMMLGATCKASGASSGLFIEKRDTGCQVVAASGWYEPAFKELQHDEPVLRLLFSLAEQSTGRFVAQGDTSFYELPSYMAALGFQTMALVPTAGSRGLLVYTFDDRLASHTAEDTVGKIKMIASDVGELIEAQAPLQHLSKVYVNILKRLARTMDNLNPFTVGYSEQMSRYAIVIAKQLGMQEDEIRDVALAAYLSNIGVLGLSGDLHMKEGKYSEIEYEMMKLHAEVGASIVNVTTGNSRVASYIKYHHERIDGAGYPSGLSGEEIPLGARIIAVVQTFLAKINGRKMRDPLPFDQALSLLKSAAGTQLDARVVGVLLAWFENKRTPLASSRRSLGSCWEMCCTPSSICEHCPAYGQLNVNCWEVADNRCADHGKACATCFVRTEALSRGEVKLHA